MRKIQLDTDCEGPLALNDNAFELCRDFIQPQGDRFFKQVSRYDDYLADILKKPGYKAGGTLKLILPFLKAFGLTNQQILDYSRKNMLLVPGVVKAYKLLHTQGFPLFEISTSYRQFAEAVGLKLGFDAQHIIGTELDLDRYRLSETEAAELRRLKDDIAASPEIELPADAAATGDLPEPMLEAIARLDNIFWETIPDMDIGRIYEEVIPIGGAEKARALSDSLAQTGVSLADTIYVGDSITDVQAFEAVRAGGGLAISFNGNRYAVKAAEVIVVADTAWPIALLANIFLLWGKEGVLEVARPESPDKSRYLVLPEEVIEPIMMGLHGHRFNLYLSNNPQHDQIAQQSAAMRSQLRGAAIATLG
jgi:predicted HAD superfamily phosphohydrolase